MHAALFNLLEETVQLLEKTAAEADTLEQKNRELTARLHRAENAGKPKQASVNETALVRRLSETLELEGLLADGVSADKMASAITENPYRMAGIMLTILRPTEEQGRPVKSAATISENPHIKDFDGRKVYDPYGFLEALPQ